VLMQQPFGVDRWHDFQPCELCWLYSICGGDPPTKAHTCF
jgi:hypothetical protein